MAENTITCGNCHTENDPGADVCSNCGLPLTRSGEEALAENEEAQATGGILGGAPAKDQGPANTYVPNADTPVKDGLPTD